MTNGSLLKKADAVLDDIASAGRLNPMQGARFVRKVMEAPTMIREARRVEMRADRMEINKIGFGSRIMRAGSNDRSVVPTALSAGDRAKPDFEQVTLMTKEAKAEVNIPYQMMEDTIERASLGQERDGGGGTPASGGIRDTIVDMIAQRAAVDLEELALQGDTALAGSDDYLGMLDGWLKLASTNVVNWGAAVEKGMFATGLRTLPDRYKRNIPSLRNFLSQNTVIDYREQLSDRATQVGDGQIQGTSPVFGMGVPITGVDLMPTSQGLLTNPLNLIFGMQRDVLIEYEKDIRAGIYVIVVSTRVDFQIEEAEALVKYTAVQPLN